MEELGVGAHNNGHYDNDFEKLPHDEDDVNSAAERQGVSSSPGGDGGMESKSIAEEVVADRGKSQLNVDESAPVKPQPAASDAVCTGCESSST